MVKGEGGEAARLAEEWREVFLAEYPGLVRHVTYLLGDRAAAEDVVQEAFVRLMRHPLPAGGPRGPWLRVAATRLAYNHLRAERRRRAREDAVLRDPALTPVAPAPGGAEGRALRQALERLAPRDRVALLLRAQGRPYAEIGPAIGVRASSVGTILARATERLRAAYGRELAEGSGSPAGPHQRLEAEGVRVP